MRYVLVPGACHGGWWYDPVVDRLRAAGHIADAVTLAGLDPDGPPAPATNLDTHVAQVEALLDGGPEPLVLVGHSYGGSVITSVADRHPDQVAGLLYLDAFVPEDGDSCWTMTNDQQRQWYVAGSSDTGLAVQPLPFFDRRARPQPIGTFLQAAQIIGNYRRITNKHYVLAADPGWMPDSPFPVIAERLRTEPDWVVTDLDCRHNVLADGPDKIMPILDQLAAS